MSDFATDDALFVAASQRKIAAYVPVTRELMADMVPVRRWLDVMLVRHVGDLTFRELVGLPRVNPNPWPRIRLFRWLPSGSA